MKQYGLLKKRSYIITFSVIFVCLVFSKRSYAYIDPGTGSYFIQFLLAALVGGLFTLKIFWKKVKLSLKNIIQKRKKHENTGDE